MKHNIIKKKKPNMFIGLKALTNWMVSRYRNEQELNNLKEKFGFNKDIIKRIISYAYNSPHIIHYINKHMNNLYDWNKYEFNDIINSLMYIFERNGILSSNSFYYLKSSKNKDINRQSIMKILDEYFRVIFDKQFNGRMLRFFYELYLCNEITIEEIIEWDRTLHNGQKTLRIKEENPPEWESQMSTSKKSVEEMIENKNKFPEEIQYLINKIQNIKKNRSECKTCPLYGQTMVVLDTNMKTCDKVDVFILGLNSGTEDAKMNQPFTPNDKSGKYVRNEISKWNKDTTWLISNTILCSTPNKEFIGKNSDIDKVRECCEPLVMKLIEKFKGELYVLVGADAAKAFSLTDKISVISGMFYDGDLPAIPVVHPSSMRNPISTEAAKKGWSAIEVKIKENQFGVDEQMLFDVKELENGNVLHVYINSEGKKQYIEKPYKLTGYVKKKAYKDCEIISDEVTDKFEYNKTDRFIILKELKQKLNGLKEIDNIL